MGRFGHLTPVNLPNPYSDKVLALAPANLLYYWPMNEEAGTVAVDLDTGDYPGTYVGVTLQYYDFPDGRKTPYFDGISDTTTLVAADLDDIFTLNEYSLSMWIRVANAGVWSDEQGRTALYFYGNASNYIKVQRLGTTDNALRLIHRANGASEQKDLGSLTTLDWIWIGITFKQSEPIARYHIKAGGDTIKRGNIGSAPYATWSIGTFASADIGTAGSAYWAGGIAHVAFWDTCFSDSVIETLAVV